MAQIKIKRLEGESLSLLRALALSLARDIDRGQTELRAELERVMDAIPTAKIEIFA